MAVRSRCRSSTISCCRSARRASSSRARTSRSSRYSICVGLILEAAEKLAAEGIDAELIDLRTLRPLDTATVIESVKKTNRLVTVEQGWPICSIGSEICSQVVEQAFDYLDAPPTKVTGKDVPMPYAANLEKLALPHVDDVIAAVKAVCYRTMIMRKIASSTWKKGSCHCGAVTFEVRTGPEIELVDCNCSMCHRTGYLHLIVPKNGFSHADAASES